MRPSFLIALAVALAACAALIEPAPIADLAPTPAPDRSAELARIDAAMADAVRATRVAAEQALAPTAAAATARPRPAAPIAPPNLPTR